MSRFDVRIFASAALAALTIGFAAPAEAAAPVAVRVQPGTSVTPMRFGGRMVAARQMYVTLRRGRAVNVRNPLLQPAGTTTIPFWSSVITSPLDGNSYTVTMAGSSPYATPQTNTNISYVPMIVRWHFLGMTWDPTQPACGDTQPISTRFYNSPLFHNIQINSNGVPVSGAGAQLISSFERANFWSSVANTAYGVTLVPSQTQPIIVDVNAPPANTAFGTINTACGVKPILAIEINAYDSMLQSLIVAHATPTQLPIALTYDVTQYITAVAQCCVLGYHSAVSVAGGTQTYAVGSYFDPGVFSGVDDIVVWSHELGEWMDDPFVQSIASVPGGLSSDLTPAWGNIGQVSGCQNNLEVGDPLSGTEFAFPDSTTGYTYHFQDLAFEDWFYRTAAQGVGGNWSFQGVLKSPQAAC